MTKVLITDTRSKVNDLDGIYFDIIVLFRRSVIMNKFGSGAAVGSSPQQETDKCDDPKMGEVVYWVGHKCTTPLKKQHLSIKVQTKFNKRPTFNHN